MGRQNNKCEYIYITLQLVVCFYNLCESEMPSKLAEPPAFVYRVLFVNLLSRELRPGTWSSFLLLLTAPVAARSASRMELNRVFPLFFFFLPCSPLPQQTLVIMWHFNDKITQSDLPSRPGHNGVGSSQ